jgi:outer membrane receptor protein involved in Fe transport
VTLVSSWNAFVGANATYHSSTTSTFAAGSEFDIAGYTLVDTRLGVEKQDQSLRVALWAQNVTDRYYWTHVDHVADCITRTTGLPATFGVSVGMRF